MEERELQRVFRILSNEPDLEATFGALTKGWSNSQLLYLKDFARVVVNEALAKEQEWERLRHFLELGQTNEVGIGPIPEEADRLANENQKETARSVIKLCQSAHLQTQSTNESEDSSLVPLKGKCAALYLIYTGKKANNQVQAESHISKFPTIQSPDYLRKAYRRLIPDTSTSFDIGSHIESASTRALKHWKSDLLKVWTHLDSDQKELARLDLHQLRDRMQERGLPESDFGSLSKILDQS